MTIPAASDATAVPWPARACAFGALRIVREGEGNIKAEHSLACQCEKLAAQQK